MGRSFESIRQGVKWIADRWARLNEYIFYSIEYFLYPSLTPSPYHRLVKSVFTLPCQI